MSIEPKTTPSGAFRLATRHGAQVAYYAATSGAFSESLRKLIELQVAEQEAEIQLMAVCPLDRRDDMLAEADRRAALMAESWAAGPRGHDRSPRTAALESVCYDVTRGVLP